MEPFDKKNDSQIQKDLDRTIPHHYEAERSSEMFVILRRVLRLFCIYRPDIGYVQGMDYLAKTLFYYFDEFQLFVMFCNLIITKPFVRSCYTFDTPRVSIDNPNSKITAYNRILDKTLKKGKKDLYRNFSKAGKRTEMYSFDWYFTLFSRDFDIKIARAIWDIFLVFGDFYLLKSLHYYRISRNLIFYSKLFQLVLQDVKLLT